MFPLIELLIVAKNMRRLSVGTIFLIVTRKRFVMLIKTPSEQQSKFGKTVIIC